ncbi:uncharacterized protein LOC105699601 [Orussus abietinus]|uniref:uncharacterized protein LOC105699601 n=1 Tax=Orussus abietinus TaxID=222816 RepID=UPI000626C6DF|nr:uncharacterized protein LOC105699601 [Orussus abietinus]
MASTVAPEAAEPDSDASSTEEQEARKRPRGDPDSSSPKKRRKQTTPVRFPLSLAAEEHAESESEAEAEAEELDRAGKSGSPSRLSSMPVVVHRRPNGEEVAGEHEEIEHGDEASSSRQLGESPDSRNRVRLAADVFQPMDASGSPIDLSGLGAKGFGPPWMSGPVQSQMQTQTQFQGEEWQSQSVVSSMASVGSHLQGLPFPNALAQYLPFPGFPLPETNPAHRVPPVGSTPVKIFNPDAYCDLCNKEFCNKYFLKTHKANKHGIYVDSPVQSAEGGSAVYSGAFPGANVKMEVAGGSTSTSGVPCEVCQKRFKNEDSLRKHRQKIHGDGVELSDSQLGGPSSTATDEDRDAARRSLTPGTVAALFRQEFAVEQEETTFMPTPRRLSPSSMQQAKDSGFSADRLHRLGVVNPEAFCELCCKEYCNKYFLRTHKMKRHGIFVQETSEKSPGNPGVAADWPQVQTSPLNLIVTENAGTGSESGDRPGEDCECKTCDLRFQTLALYQAHRRKMHSGYEQRSPKTEGDAESSDQRTDSISEDLRKLQTMILQLNGLESVKGTSCAEGGKEFDAESSFRAHVAAEDPTSPSKEAESSPTPLPKSCCALCEKEFPDYEALRGHITEEHQPGAPSSTSPMHPLPAPATSGPSTTPALQPERKFPSSVTPTSSYCEICNKELCNKYFMKTHMQRMHGIEIENGAQIGGVICNICNKELCSKYFLRVHKHNTHGIVEESPSGSTKQETYDSSSTEDPALKPEQLSDLSHRYFNHFTEVCPVCNRRFRSLKWLKAHLLGEHGKVGMDKWREMEQQGQSAPKAGGRSSGPSKVSGIRIPNGSNGSEPAPSLDAAGFSGMGSHVLTSLFGASTEEQRRKSYRCSYCGFATSVLPYLFLHEKSHTGSQEAEAAEGDRALRCPVCSQGFAQPELLHHHLLTRHQFPLLLSHFQAPALQGPELPPQEPKDDPPRGSAADSPGTARKPDDAAVRVTPQGAYKCAQCGFATANLNRIKKHVKKDHRSIGDPCESVIAELGKALKDVANKHKVPASYAVPQEAGSPTERTIMQPFKIEECDAAPAGEEAGRFAPALVYLPVRTRVTNVLTASFTLSPA